MAKFEKPSEAIAELFEQVKETTTIPNWIEFELRTNNKQNEIYKIVKLNDLIGSLTDGLNFAVVINEEIMEQLPVDLQEILLAECIAGVRISETDAVSMEKPDFNSYTGILQKYGHEKIIMVKESVKSLYDTKKQKDDEAKSQKKAKKTKKSEINKE
jgi:hypothetical protein